MLEKIKRKLRLKSRERVRFIPLDSWDSGLDVVITAEGIKEIVDERKKVEPIELLPLLETKIKIPERDLNKLIKEVKKRIKFLEDDLDIEPENEIRVLDILTARKKYPKFAHLFSWPTTVESKIEMLTKQFMVRHRPIEAYTKSLPSRAITQMKLFSDLQKKIIKRKPEFTLIAPDKHFKSKDPILLAKSPFGEYYYILCAWDKEISLVNNLLDERDIIDNPKQYGRVPKRK